MWKMMQSGYIPDFRMMCRVIDAARKIAVDSCTLKVEALDHKDFAGLKGPEKNTMIAGAT